MKDSICERDVIIQEYKMYNNALKEKSDEVITRVQNKNGKLTKKYENKSILFREVGF